MQRSGPLRNVVKKITMQKQMWFIIQVNFYFVNYVKVNIKKKKNLPNYIELK
jgi:hypothetical protein